MKGTYKIADKIMLIDSVHDGIHKFCRECACEGEAELRIVTVQSDIDNERAVAHFLLLAADMDHDTSILYASDINVKHGHSAGWLA